MDPPGRPPKGEGRRRKGRRIVVLRTRRKPSRSFLPTFLFDIRCFIDPTDEDNLAFDMDAAADEAVPAPIQLDYFLYRKGGVDIFEHKKKLSINPGTLADGFNNVIMIGALTDGDSGAARFTALDEDDKPLDQIRAYLLQRGTGAVVGAAEIINTDVMEVQTYVFSAHPTRNAKQEFVVMTFNQDDVQDPITDDNLLQIAGRRVFTDI